MRHTLYTAAVAGIVAGGVGFGAGALSQPDAADAQRASEARILRGISARIVTLDTHTIENGRKLLSINRAIETHQDENQGIFKQIEVNTRPR